MLDGFEHHLADKLKALSWLEDECRSEPDEAVSLREGLLACDEAENPHGKNQWSSGGTELLDINHDTRANWRKLGRFTPAELDKRIEQAREDEEYGVSTVRVLSSDPNRPDGKPTKSNEWYTPTKYVETARSVLGKIDLDPASSEEANERIQAAHFYSPLDDGLSLEWKGRVWLNPPYGGKTAQFVEKLLAEWEVGNVKTAILLVNANSTDTVWFAPLWDHTLCFTDHRIDFDVPEGVEKTSSSNHGSVFVYLGEDIPKFALTFRQYGAVVRSWP